MRRRYFMLSAAVLGLALTAVAQKPEKSNTRAVQGLITDSDDKPVPKATVQLKDSKTKQIRSFFSLDDGTYRFYGLNPNIDYELSATDGTRKSETRLLSTYDGRKLAVINLKLEK